MGLTAKQQNAITATIGQLVAAGMQYEKAVVLVKESAERVFDGDMRSTIACQTRMKIGEEKYGLSKLNNESKLVLARELGRVK